MAVVVVGQEEKDKAWRGVAGSALGLVAWWRVCCGLRCFPWHEINFGCLGRWEGWWWGLLRQFQSRGGGGGGGAGEGRWDLC